MTLFIPIAFFIFLAVIFFPMRKPKKKPVKKTGIKVQSTIYAPGTPRCRPVTTPERMDGGVLFTKQFNY